MTPKHQIWCNFNAKSRVFGNAFSMVVSRSPPHFKLYRTCCWQHIFAIKFGYVIIDGLKVVGK